MASSEGLRVGGLGKQQIDEALRGRLRLVISKAGLLVRFDDYIIGAGGIRYQQVQPHHWDINHTRCRAGHLHQYRVKLQG